MGPGHTVWRGGDDKSFWEQSGSDRGEDGDGLRKGVRYDERIAKMDSIRTAKRAAMESKIEFTMKKHGLKKASCYALPSDVKTLHVKALIEDARRIHVRLHIDAVKTDKEATQKKMMEFSLKDARDLLSGDGHAVIEMVERKMNPNLKVMYIPPSRKPFLIYGLFDKQDLLDWITTIHEERNTFLYFK